MGMSASQARYLGLIARQNDLEYQGQQINQERTVLSQQVTDLYNTLQTLEIPVPPSTSDFTTIQYSGTDRASKFTLGYIVPDGEFYNVEMNYTKTGHSLKEKGIVEVTKTEADDCTTTYSVGSSEVMSLTKAGTGNYNWISDDTKADYIEAIRNFFNIEKPLNEVSSEEDGYPTEGSDDWIIENYSVYFTQTGENTAYVAHFVKNDALASVNDENPLITTYDYTESGSYTYTDYQENCMLTFDTAGRITEIKIPTGFNNDNTPKTWNTVKLTAATITDQNAYQDAYAKYEYAKYEYDREQQEINAKTKIIQQEDKNLELKLQRLDNERTQITTEIEAVDKVISDNIEKSYKTFSG